jgi:hypothetical protein
MAEATKILVVQLACDASTFVTMKGNGTNLVWDQGRVPDLGSLIGAVVVECTHPF